MSGSLTSELTVDLGALSRNWRKLDQMVGPDCQAAAVVKGNGYGCGAGTVGEVLVNAGVQTFFVAVPDEGAQLRAALGPDPTIYILGGFGLAEAALYTGYDLRPVLNSAVQYHAWFSGPAGPAAIQLDTGMNRLGMEADELVSLGTLSSHVKLVMSHMGCADVPGHPVTAHQLAAFREMTAGMTGQKSLSATAGALLGPDFHFDMVRIGIGLFGGLPFEDSEPVVQLHAPIIQIRDVAAGESVGYGASCIVERPTRIATLSAGYADGLIRHLSHGACGFISGQAAPFAGRVSMDLITLDITGIDCAPGDMVEILGPHQSIDDLARDAGTIGHEILTSLGSRYARRYIGV
ncbi:MAG: alanine racemase [Paracoccaceae bacterium]